MLTIFFKKKRKLEHLDGNPKNAKLYAQKYFPFSKMDKKNVQKRKPEILLGRKNCKNYSRGFLVLRTLNNSSRIMLWSQMKKRLYRTIIPSPNNILVEKELKERNFMR